VVGGSKEATYECDFNQSRDLLNLRFRDAHTVSMLKLRSLAVPMKIGVRDRAECEFTCISKSSSAHGKLKNA
jgi:hypothetical protein